MSKLLLLSAPSNLSITFDFNSWTTGPLFKGIKDIPPGIHYITTNLDHVFGRSGFFIDAGIHDLIVRQWDALSNSFQSVTDHDQLERIYSGLKEIEIGLGRFPLDDNDSWAMHSSCITWRLLQKICPGNTTDTVTSSSRLSQVEDLRLDSCNTINFTLIDLKHSYPDGSHGEIRSKYSMDKSWLLDKLIKESSREDILGELQVSFLMFILGQFYDGFDQWKIMVHMICNSEEMLSCDAEFFVKFAEIIMVHLKECPDDFFRDIISQDNFLTSALLSLARNASDASTTGLLDRTLDKLWSLVYDRFQWDIQSQVRMTDLHRENDEYAPVVVE